MILEILIFLITTLFVYYLYSNKKVHFYFQERGVKFLPGVPFFGNVFHVTFLKRHFLEDLDPVYNAFPDEKYVGWIEFSVPVLLIRDPELIKNITVKDFDHFTDHRDFISEETEPLFGASLIFMKGEKWRNMRTTLSPAFTSSKMKFMFQYFVENTNNIINYINDNKNQIIDVDDLVRRYTNDVIASAGFGITVNSLVDRNNEFYELGNTVLDFNFRQLMLMTFFTHFPAIAKKSGIRLLSKRVYNFFTGIVANSIEQRKKDKVVRADMIQLLMETSRDFTPDEIAGQVFLFFIAGFETSASTLVMTLHELALNPDVQETLYQEIRQFEKENKLSFDSVNELKYMDCVLNESLRKWSPAIMLDRTCVKTYELPPPGEGGKPVVLKPGDVVYNMVNCLHMDAKHFPQPEKFDPERWLDENKHNIKPFTYMPFGSGPRFCIGMRFAMVELKVLLYHIVKDFKILKTEKTLDPIKLKPHNFKISAAGGTWLLFEPRNQ